MIAHTFFFIRSILSYFRRTYSHARLITNVIERRRYLIDQVHAQAKTIISDLNFDVRVIGFDENVKPGQNYLTVGNHLSYLDPFILASAHRTLFVTSEDMRETPVLGQVCEIAGCIFVERRNRTTIEKDIADMTETLKAGLGVAIYPEGRSTDGRDVYPFKKSLLMSAVFAGKDILPVVIKYIELDGRPFTFENSDDIAWYGDMSFSPHFLKVMKMKSLKVELHFLPPISVTPNSTRSALAEAARSAIRAVYLADR